MSVEPITITTTHDSPLFDPEDHRAAAAAQLNLKPDEIHCLAAGPDEFHVKQEAEYTEAIISQDGTVLKPSELTRPRIVDYERRTTWGPKPRPQHAAEPERVVAPDLEHNIPTLARGARWHGVKNGVEGNYISTGTDLVVVDSPEGLALQKAISGVVVG